MIFATQSASAVGGPGLTGRVAVLSAAPLLIAASGRALARLGGAPPLVLRGEADLLAAVLRGCDDLTHLLQDGSALVEPTLLDALAEASPQARISMLPLAAPETDPAALEALVLDLLTRPSPPGATPGAQRGLHDGGLLLRYQPIVRVRDRRLVMVEALARWRSDPVALGPGSFVPAMERAGLARLLAGAVTRIAARDLMRETGRGGPVVSVNLPVEELEKRDTLAWIARQLGGSRLPRRRLAIELTETSPVRDLSRLARSVARLRAAGHEVLIDDFELDDRRRRLLRLPFSGVKLDKGLVQQLARSARARQQVRRLTRAGHVVTAEGVSSEAIWRCLRALGVQRAQGFWLARPLPIAALPAWTALWRAGRLRAERPGDQPR